MSKKTFFKRIALSAIAALGLGMLSAGPSSAVAGTPTLTVTTGNASVTEGTTNETSTAATVRITGLLSNASDTYSVVMIRKSAPATAMSNDHFVMAYMETNTYLTTKVATAVGFGTLLYSGADGAYDGGNTALSDFPGYDSVTPGTHYYLGVSAAGYVDATFGLMAESSAAALRSGNEGTYVYTVIVTPYTANQLASTPVSADVSFTIDRTAAAQAAINGTIDPSKTTAYLGAGTTVPTSEGTNVTALATSSTTTRATLAVRTYTSDSDPAPESVTVVISGPGLVGTSASGVWGKSITVAGDGAPNFLIRSDGTSGKATITVSTTTVTFPAKTMNFYSAAASTVEVSTARPVIGVGTTNDVIRATFKDATGTVWAGAAYIYASTAADALVGGSTTPVACTWDSGDNRHECPVNGLTAGTGNFKVIDASTVALATTTSDAVSTRVSTGIASSIVLSFDKATYAPGEKAQLRVSVLDGAGLAMPGGTISNAFAASMTTSKAFGPGSATITSVDAVLSGVTSAAADLNAGHQTYVVYMPSEAGAVTVTGVGGAGVAAAGRVAVTASATVVKAADPEVVAAQAAAEAASDAALEAIDAANAATDAANLAAEAADAATVASEEARDAADAATAAVEALASEVATLMAALKAQITTLAKTVAKIAKKVKA